MRKTKAQLKQTAMKLLPTNKALGIKPTRKQKVTAEKIVADAVAATRGGALKAALQGRTVGPVVSDLPMQRFPKLPKRDLRAYEPLEDNFERSGKQHRKVWQNDWASMYEVKCCDAVVYEVFMRVFAEAASGEIKGVKFSTPAREVFPSDRVFGATAWCALTQAHAAVLFRHAVETAVKRHLEKVGA